MQFHPSIRFAWYGSGQKWDDLRLQALGCAIGGFLFWALGLKVPQEILDNPALGALAGIAIGGVAGAAVVFLLRLCWYPLHSLIEAKGGYHNLLKSRSGGVMWPAILMILGVICFVLFFGGGAIWFVVDQQTNLVAQNKAEHLSLPSAPASVIPATEKKAELSFEDRQFRLDERKFVLSDCRKLFDAYVRAMNEFISNSDLSRSNEDASEILQIYNNSFVVSSVMKSWQDLVEYAQLDVEKIDPEALSLKIVAFLKDYKSQSFQILLVERQSKNKSFIESLRLIDKKAKDNYLDIRNSTSKYLKEPLPSVLFLDQN